MNMWNNSPLAIDPPTNPPMAAHSIRTLLVRGQRTNLSTRNVSLYRVCVRQARKQSPNDPGKPADPVYRPKHDPQQTRPISTTLTRMI